MSKKRFTGGLDRLLQSEDQASSPRDRATRSKKSEEKTSSKSFTADLQSFLEEAFEESFETQMEERTQARQQSPLPQTTPSGLDALIRSTIEPDSMEVARGKVRRLVLTFDDQKLEKLQEIARHKETYLRDIIDQIVGSFIDDYEKQKKRKT